MKAIILSLGVLCAFLIVVAIGLPFLGGDSGKSRLKAVRARREAMRRELQESAVRTVSLRDKLKQKTLAQKISERFRLERIMDMDKLKNSMMTAGWRSAEAPSRFLVALVVLPIVFGLYTAFMVYAGPLAPKVDPGMRPLACLGMALVGFLLPRVLLKNAIQKRAQKLSKQFPDALDLMLVCVEAGLSVEQSLMRVTEEIGEAIPEIGEEFALTGAELAFLGDRRTAYDNLVARTDSAEFKSLATTLIQSEKYGTSVAASLRVLSDESRKNRTNLVEKKAAGLGPKMTVPMILFILPCLFMIVIGPAIINL